MDKHSDALSSIFHSLPRKRERSDITQLKLFNQHWTKLDPDRLPSEVRQKMKEYFDELERIERLGIELRDTLRPFWIDQCNDE